MCVFIKTRRGEEREGYRRKEEEVRKKRREINLRNWLMRLWRLASPPSARYFGGLETLGRTDVGAQSKASWLLE